MPVNRKLPQIDPHARRLVTLRITEDQLRIMGAAVLDHCATLLQSDMLEQRVAQDGIYPNSNSFRTACKELRDAIISQYQQGELIRPYRKEK